MDPLKMRLMRSHRFKKMSKIEQMQELREYEWQKQNFKRREYEKMGTGPC